MELIQLKDEDVYLPDYVVQSLKELSWMECEGGKITFHPDDLILIHYGTRGSTSFTGPSLVRYGSNTTCYQIFSPKLPADVVYLGDGGSGMMEASKIIFEKLKKKGINPFTAKKEDLTAYYSHALISFTHYHYDHLHLGFPLTGLAHANSLDKVIIGSDNPKLQIRQAFRRPVFPRDFGEIASAYSFYDIKEPRSTLMVYLPNGDYKVMDLSAFDTVQKQANPKIRHKGLFYELHECLVVRTCPLSHPDPCNSYRYENYDKNGDLKTAITFMTDHETQETHSNDMYYVKQMKGSDYLYIDGQYDEETYVPGYGHGRVEVAAKIMAEVDLPFVGIGHHDPNRTDYEIDEMIQKAKSVYKDRTPKGTGKIIGASDRMMVFVPAKSRNRRGVVFGRMDVSISEMIADDIGAQIQLKGNYKNADLTSTYNTIDETVLASQAEVNS